MFLGPIWRRIGKGEVATSNEAEIQIECRAAKVKPRSFCSCVVGIHFALLKTCAWWAVTLSVSSLN